MTRTAPSEGGNARKKRNGAAAEGGPAAEQKTAAWRLFFYGRAGRTVDLGFGFFAGVCYNVRTSDPVHTLLKEGPWTIS